MKESRVKGNLTLCDLVLNGDIPRYDTKCISELEELVSHWLESKKDETVFVCFQNWRNGECSEEQNRFLVTHKKEEIELEEMDWLSRMNFNNVDYAIFEFISYEEAFKYCIDLKEGF